MSDPGFGSSKLGGLPDLGYGPVTAQPVPVPSYGPTVDAWNKVASDAENIGNNYLKQQATQQGSAAVTRDAQGNLQKPATRFPLTPADDAYNNAAQMAYLSQAQIDSYNSASALKQQYPNDPDGFRAAWDKSSAQALDQAPGTFQPALREQLDRDGASAYQDVLTQQRTNTVKAAADNTDALLKQNTDSLQPYIANGTWNTDPAAQSLVQQNLSILDSKLHNPAFPTYTQAQHDLDANNFLNGITAQAAVAQVPQIWQESGGNRAVAEQKFTSLINSLPISWEDKTNYTAKGLAEIRDQNTLSRQDRFENEMNLSNSVADAKAVGVSGSDSNGWRSRLPESQIWATYANDPARAQQTIEQLDLADGIGQIGNETALASPADRAVLGQKYAPPSGVPTTPKMPIGQAIFGQESRFGANTTPNGVSTGPMQVTAPTWQTAENQGLVHPGEDINNSTDNYNVGQRIVAQYQQKYNNDPARVAVAYFSGPGNVSAVGSPNPYVKNLVDPTSGKSTASYVSDVLGRMGVSGSTLDNQLQWQLSKAYDTATKQIDTQIGADPADYVRSNVPSVAQQVDSTDPQTRAGGVNALLAWESHIGVAPGDQAVFTKDQASQLSNTIQFSPSDQAIAALKSATAGMTPQQAQIAARQVAPNNRAFAMAVSAVPSDPLTASNIIMGEQYLLSNPDVKPDEKKSGAAFDGATAPGAGWVSSAPGGLFQFAPSARANAMAATNALYAKSMIGQPDMKAGAANFDATRYTAAMQQALGGAPINLRGQVILPPAPGYDAAKTEDMVSGLTSAQISQFGNGTPVLANGKPVAASDIAQHGVLTWTGSPGLYRVRFPGQGHLGVSGSSDGSRTFMLNLGALATGATAPLPGPSSSQAGASTNSWVQ